MVLSVTDVVLSTVKPLHTTAHLEAIEPTFMDLMSKDMFFPVFFAYRPPNNGSKGLGFSRLLNGIKESLQKVLVPFFGFAGRWVESPAAERGHRRLLCNDEGVPFIDAFVDADLDSVVHTSAAFQPVGELQGHGVLGMDMTRFQQKMPPDGLPCIFVQVTRFKCGGIVVAVTFNHCHTDGRGFFSFMRAWSDLCRTNETAVMADHSRAMTDIPSFTNLILEQTSATASSTDGVHGIDGVEDGGCKNGREPWAFKAFEVNGSVIKSLKQDAEQGNDSNDREGAGEGNDSNDKGGGYVSSVDCIVAHVWRSLARLPCSLLGERELSVGIDVEGRNRFYEPPVPDLCGNVLTVMSTPKIGLNELREMPLASIARKLREKLQTTSREEWLGLERFRESIEAFESRKFAVMPTTSWFNFPMYDIDFGFGKPFFASGVNNLCSTGALGVANILPPIPSSSSSSIAIVYMWSTSEILRALCFDPDFLPFFLPHPNAGCGSSE